MSKILGARSIIYGMPKLEEGASWYARVLEIEPYFKEPFYVGFDVGGFELGLLPSRPAGAGGTRAYWGVEDARAERDRILGIGATLVSDVQDVGDGILMVVLGDPFGNEFGLIQNPHFKLPS